MAFPASLGRHEHDPPSSAVQRVIGPVVDLSETRCHGSGQ